jgi:hypothetical protein
MKDYEPSAQTKYNNEPYEIVRLRGKEIKIYRYPITPINSTNQKVPFPFALRPLGIDYDYRNNLKNKDVLVNNEGLPVHPADQIVYSAPPIVQTASTPAAAPVSTPAPATSKNIAPYVYAGIGLIVILLIARMVTKK